MSTQPIHERILANPKFQRLAARRGRLALLLSATVLVAYYIFMMLVAFNPKALATPLSEGSALTVGVPFGAAIIIISWLLTGYYVYRANGEFDQLNEEVMRETKP